MNSLHAQIIALSWFHLYIYSIYEGYIYNKSQRYMNLEGLNQHKKTYFFEKVPKTRIPLKKEEIIIQYKKKLASPRRGSSKN
jgi:hypothetical protein